MAKDTSQGYAEKLRSPKWQKRRLEILQRDNFTCQTCGDDESTLTVHHRYYVHGREPWEYSDAELVTLCESCHEQEHEDAEAPTNLIRAMKRKGFTNFDLRRLAEAFEEFHPTHPAEVHRSALETIIRYEFAMSDLVEWYLRGAKKMAKLLNQAG